MSHPSRLHHIFKATIFRVRVGGKFWLFTFGDLFGPLIVDGEGRQLSANKQLADEGHPFWDAFEKWYAEKYPLPQALKGPTDE